MCDDDDGTSLNELSVRIVSLRPLFVLICSDVFGFF